MPSLPMPSINPLSGLPPSRSPELKCTVSFAPTSSVTGPYATPASSNASTDTSPTSPERLMMRTNPWYPFGLSAAANSGTSCSPAASPSPASGSVERFVRCPVGLDSRLITSMGWSDVTTNCHFPCPSSSIPASPSPSPDSSSSDVTIRDAPDGTSSSTSVPGVSPSSSMPSMVTDAVSSPRLMMRRRLTWLTLLAGLKMATRWPIASSPVPGRRTTAPGTRSCSGASNPSLVRL